MSGWETSQGDAHGWTLVAAIRCLLQNALHFVTCLKLLFKTSREGLGSGTG